MTSANSCKDFSISRTEGDPLNTGNDISMNDPGNDVFSTIPPLKLARMGMSPQWLSTAPFIHDFGVLTEVQNIAFQHYVAVRLRYERTGCPSLLSSNICDGNRTAGYTLE